MSKQLNRRESLKEVGAACPTTMRDIASNLGVSVGTVSKVLRHHSDVGKATRKQVLDRVKDLGYTPNIAARSLVTGKTYLVGLIVPNLLHPLFAQMTKSLSRVLLKKGYCLTVSTSEEDGTLDEDEINLLLNRRLDTLVIASSSIDSSALKSIQKRGVPFVLIDRNLPELEASYVGTDDEAIGLLATEHLIEIGCERIAHLYGPDNSAGAGCLKGYHKALAKHNLKPFASYVTMSQLVDRQSKESGVELMRRLLASGSRPDGVFCFNDPMAIGAIHAILDAGLSVPEDVAVIGSGNLRHDFESHISLSTIDQQSAMIAEQVEQLTLSLLESITPPPRKTIIIQPQLVVRASTDKGAKIRRGLGFERCKTSLWRA